MILSNELLSRAIDRINELQNETIQKADKIQGSKEYVDKQMQLFQEAEEYRKMLNVVIHQQEQISQEFVK